MASFVPFAETDGVAPGFANFVMEYCVQSQLTVRDNVIAQVIVVAGEEHVLVPVGHRAETTPSQLNPLYDRIALRVKLSHDITVDNIDHGTLRWLQ